MSVLVCTLICQCITNLTCFIVTTIEQFVCVKSITLESFLMDTMIHR